MIRAFKYRLYPSKAQITAFDGMLGAFCDLYNAGLQQRIEAYRRQGKTLRYADQANELKAVRLADERLAGFSHTAEQQVLRRLDKAFAAFFRRLKTKGKAGFPRFRSKSRFDSADFRVGDGLTIRKSRRLGIVGIPGEVKVRWHRSIPPGSKVGAAVLTRQAGRWYICFQIDMPEVYGPWPLRPQVGVDVGLLSLAALSTGETIQTPQWTKQAAKKLRRHQRAVARCRRGSQGRRKAKQRMARFSAHVANQRRDFLHKLSRRLADRFSHIAFEDLGINKLARSMLAKAVHNAAWGQLISLTTYKAESAGRGVVTVDPRGTSQACSGCGALVAKTLATRTHRCDCGCVLDRDVNAAKVIEHRAFPVRPGTGLEALSGPVAA